MPARRGGIEFQDRPARRRRYVQYFLDTQLYSYLANGTISPERWKEALGRRELWLSPVTAYELLEGLLNAGPHTQATSIAALTEAARIPTERILWRRRAPVKRWLVKALAGEALPPDFYDFRRRINAGRRRFLGQIRSFMNRVMPHWRRLGDPLFAAEWTGKRKAGELLDAAFVFQTAVLERAMRIRYNPERHPSDYLDYLQLGFLKKNDLVFITADRKLVQMTLRSRDSDRIMLWDEL